MESEATIPLVRETGAREGGTRSAVTVWTIGHSTRALDDFLALLERERIERLVDVRAFPASRRYPHFNGEALAASLGERGISYRHAPELGGRRTAPKESAPSAWRNSGFRGYAYYMTTPAFAAALASLRDDARRDRTVIMCAEALPWRCHRNLISDALVAGGDAVLHIGESGVSDHKLTKFAVVTTAHVVTYPPESPASQLSLLGE
jgi:uncharacterized protein (DUF488 family)